MTGRRRRFAADFKAKVALEALRGDRTIQEIAARHQVHPNQVSAWKRQAVDGLGDVFSSGAERRLLSHAAHRSVQPRMGLGDIPMRDATSLAHRRTGY